MTGARGKPPAGEPSLEGLLTVRAVAAAVGANAKTVRAWVKRGELTAIRIGRLIRVRREDFMRFLKRREIKSISRPSRRKPEQ